MQHEDIEGNKIPSAKWALAPRLRRLRFLAAITSICFLLSSGTANAQMCGQAFLTGTFTSPPPCSLPQPPVPPGSLFQQYLQTWWNGQFLPNLKAMTAQLYTYRIWETLELGQLMDAQDVNRAARVEQEQRVTAQQGAHPDEETCVAGSSPYAISRTALTAAALTEGFKQDILRRAHNAVQQPVNGSYTPPEVNPRTNREVRWQEYCKEFFDPKSNDGQSGCQGAGAGPVMNDDISVEGFLFRDTIDLNNTDEYKAAEALLINIIEPIVHDNLLPTVVPTTEGHEHILRLQHLEAIRNIAADVVGSIIARRAPLASTDQNLADQVVEIRKKAGITQCPPSPQPQNTTCYTTTPSYNEIMQALTKERFFVPSYFFYMENNPGAIQQEQAAIDGYTTVQLQDIYKLQEQINALLAARASLKLATDQNSNQTGAAPN